MSESANRNEALEILLTEHERVLEQYSVLLQDQQSQINKLKNRIQLLEQKLAAGADRSHLDSGHEPPPHY